MIGNITAPVLTAGILISIASAAGAAELSYIETSDLKAGSQVFQPNAVAFSADGKSVLCSEVAFHIAKEQPSCFAVLTVEDVRSINRLAGQGSSFETPSGLNFAAGIDGTVLGITDGSLTVAVAGAADAAIGRTMSRADIAAFLGVSESALGAGAAAALGGRGLAVELDADASLDEGGLGVDADASAEAGKGISLDADASVSKNGGGLGASADVDADAGGLGVDAGVDVGAGSGGGSGGGGSGGSGGSGGGGIGGGLL